MKTVLFNRSLLLKSLSAFTISALVPGVNKAFFKTSEAFSTSDHHNERAFIHHFSPLLQQPGISSADPGLRPIEGVTEMEWGVYESYIWFMGMMLILEIVIFFVKNFSKNKTEQQISASEKPIYQYKEEQEWPHKLKSFLVHIVKTIFISSLCYFIFTVIVVGIYLVCNPSNQSRDSTPIQDLRFSDLSVRSLEEISIKSHVKQEEKGVHKNPVRAERVLISSPLNSMVVQDIAYSSNRSISSMLFSNDGTKAFLASYLNSNQTCSFLIADISEDHLTDSVYIGSISFPLTANVGPLSDNSYPLSLALSSDGKTAFMTTPSALQIIDISDPTSPVAKPNLTMPSTDLLYSVTLSPDEQNAFLLRNSSSTGYQIVVIDVESLETPTLLNSSSQPYYSLYTHEQLMFVSVSNLSMWEVYNISDMANITLQGTLNFENFEGVQSVGFSSDYQTAYVGTSLNGSGHISIVNISGGVISNIISTTPLVSGFDIDYMASIVESPAGRHLFVAGDPALQIFDISNSTSPISLAPTAIPGPVSMAITSNGQQGIFIEDSGEYYLINFNLNLVLNQAVNLQSNVIETLNVSSGLNAMALTPDGCTLYMSSANSLTVVNVTNPSNYTMLPSFPVTRPLFQMTFSSDGEYLFGLSTSSNKCSFDIYDVLSAQLMSSYDLYCDNPQLTQSFVINADENIAVIADSLVSFVILDISDKTNPDLLSDNTFISASRLTVALLPDGQTAFIGGSTFDISTLLTVGVLNIYDISTPDDPQLMGSYTVESGGIMSLTIFPEASLTYMITKGSNLDSFLTVLDISSPTAPTIVNTISLLQVCHDNYATAMIVPMLPNDLVLLISTDSTVLVADISMPELPNYVGAYLSSDSATTNDIGVTYGSNTLLVGVSEGVTMISLKPEYILDFMLDEISMGQTVTLPLNVFTKNSQGTYDASLSNYKFTDLLRYNPVQTNLVFDIVQTYTELDNWVIFDQGTGQLTVATNLKADYQVGTYDLFASVSTQIPDTTFIGIGSINDTNSSIDLMVALVGLGYVDNEGYLTSSFDPDQSLLLGSEYMDDEEKIRTAMSKYYIQAWTTFTIMQSLELILPGPGLSANSNTSISISTPSPKTINMFITLENGQFVTNGYPFSVDFSSNNMQVGIVGSLSSVNDILPQLIIYLNKGDSCDGQVNVTDSLNPTLTESVANISSHFKISSEPSIDTNTFEDQLNNVSIVTGDQFFIPFSASIFTDSNNQPLTFTLKMQDGSEVPYWLALKGLTLVGTPPMQLSERNLKVKITASNQYQSRDVDFTLSVGLSFEYILKLIATYGGAFITVVGLYVYAARIYNIFAKRFYTYSKKFVIKVGEEVTAKTLYPIAFHGTALQESKLIMSHLDKKILTELKNAKTAATSNALARYFCMSESYKLDQDKLSQKIEETATSMLRENKTKLKIKLYTEGTDSDRKLIQQLIINRFVIRMLDLNEEKPTKTAFEKIKKEIFSLVDFTACLENGCCRFSVNKPKLQAKFKDCKIKTFTLLAENDEGEIHLLDSEEDPSARKSKVHDSSNSFAKKSQPNQKSLEKELLEVDLPGTPPNQHRSGPSMDRLIDAIEAYAFNYHIIDSDILKIDVIARQKMDNIWPPKAVKRFIKWDLQLVGFSGKGIIGCGIRYQFKENVLVFSGIANQQIRDETLVIQIVTRRGRILRELWLNGVEDEQETNILRHDTT